MSTEFRRVLPVHVPTVAFKGARASDESAFRRAAENLDTGHPIGGGCVKAAVAQLLRAAADALAADGQPDPEWSYHAYQAAERQAGR